MPSWALALETERRLDDFCDELSELLRRRKVEVTTEQLRTGELTVDGRSIPLGPLAEACAGLHSFDWWSTMTTAVDEAKIGAGATKGASERSRRRERSAPEPRSPHTIRQGETVIDLHNGPFEAVAPLLKVQLFTDHSRGAFAALDHSALVLRMLCEGLHAVLMFDFGGHSQTVGASELERWGVVAEEVWARALANVDAEPVTASRKGEMVVIYGNANFVAARAVELADSTRGASDGASVFVGVPTWHSVLLWRTTTPGQIDTTEMATLTRNLCEQDDPVSPDLFVVRDGVWSRVGA